MAMAAHEADGTLHIALVSKPDGSHGFPKLAGDALRRVLSGHAGVPCGAGRPSTSGSDGGDSCAPVTPTFASPAAASAVGAATPLSLPATPIAAGLAPPAGRVSSSGSAGAACRALDPITDSPLLEGAAATGRWEVTPDNAWDDAAGFLAGWECGYDSDAASEPEDWAILPRPTLAPADAPYLAALGAAAAARVPLAAAARFAPTEGNPLDDGDAFAVGFGAGAATWWGYRDVSILGRLDASYGNPLEQPGFGAAFEAGCVLE